MTLGSGGGTLTVSGHVNVPNVFFFRAADSIRDDLVTGVQTCAIPILANFTGPVTSTGPLTVSGGALNFNSSSWRSEERRVGKECWSRWSMSRYKNKVMWFVNIVSSSVIGGVVGGCRRVALLSCVRCKT